MSNLIRFETADVVVNMASVILNRESIIGYAEKGDATLLYLKHGHTILVDGLISDVVEKVLRSRYEAAGNDRVTVDCWVAEKLKNLGYAGLESNID